MLTLHNNSSAFARFWPLTFSIVYCSNHGNQDSLEIPHQSVQEAEKYARLHVKCALILYDGSQNWSVSTNFYVAV